MKYQKPPLLFTDQVNLLLSRGLIGDPILMRDRLSSVNYYRLSGYLHPYKIFGGEDYQPGTQFDTVWNHYAFDRRLRLLVMDAIERIEIAVRTQLAYHHARIYKEPFAYSNQPISLPGLRPTDYHELLTRIRKEKDDSEDLFVSHFKTKYGDDHTDLPIWMAVEIMSFGTLQHFYRGSSHQVKQEVATYFGMPDVIFDSWLHALLVVRNICAHHGRLWNRVLGVRPKRPRIKEYPDWYTPIQIPNDRVFGILTICRYCLRIIAPQSHWPLLVTQLLNDYHTVSTTKMGFPANWQNSPLWK